MASWFSTSSRRSRKCGAVFVTTRYYASRPARLALGPVRGDLLVDIWSWTVFWFNLILGAAAEAQHILPPESVSTQCSAVESGGFIGSSLSLAAATYATITGETHGYKASLAIDLYAVAILAGATFIAIGVPASFCAQIITALTTDTLLGQASAYGANSSTAVKSIIDQVVKAAHRAFAHGLDRALGISPPLLVVAAVAGAEARVRATHDDR